MFLFEDPEIFLLGLHVDVYVSRDLFLYIEKYRFWS